MEMVKKIKRFDVEINETELRIGGDFEKVSAWPIRDKAEKVYIAFYPDARVKVQAGALGGVSGNMVRWMDVEEFCVALFEYQQLKEAYKKLEKEYQRLQEKYNELKTKYQTLEKELDKAGNTKSWSNKYSNVWYPILNDKQLKAVLRKIIF